MHHNGRRRAPDFLGALFNRDGIKPSLLHVPAATVRTDNITFLVFGGSQRL